MRRQKCRILVCVGALLQPQDYTTLIQAHPTFAQTFWDSLPDAIVSQTDALNDWPTPKRDSQGILDAIHHGLELAKSQDPPCFDCGL
jgi:hypothetical protein